MSACSPKAVVPTVVTVLSPLTRSARRRSISETGRTGSVRAARRYMATLERMVEALRRIVEEVSALPHRDEALATIVRRVKEAMRVDACSVYLVDAAGSHFVLVATDGLNSPQVGIFRAGRQEGLVGCVAERPEPINLAAGPGIHDSATAGFIRGFGCGSYILSRSRPDCSRASKSGSCRRSAGRYRPEHSTHCPTEW
jgi:GAF domain